MIYSKDQWIQLPTKDLYDSQIMLASINAARDMYEKGLQETKEFNKLYGDFTSPIARDVDYWYDNTLKPVRDAINYMYDKGIDPTRSAEGRALIQKLINQAPVAKLNQIRQSAKVADEYVKNRGTMQANGLYDPGFEQFALRDQYGRPVDLSTWSTIDDGTWERTAPYKYESLYDYTSPMFKDLKPHELTKAEVEGFDGWRYDPRYQYQGITKKDLARVTGERIPGVQNDTLYKYYRDRAADVVRKQYIAAGKNPAEITQDEIDRQFVQDVIQANSARIMEPTKSADQFAVIAQNHANEMSKIKFQEDRQDARQARQLAAKLAKNGSSSSASPTLTPGSPYDVLVQQVINQSDQYRKDLQANFKTRKKAADTAYRNLIRLYGRYRLNAGDGKQYRVSDVIKHYLNVARKYGWQRAVQETNKTYSINLNAIQGKTGEAFRQYITSRKNYEAVANNIKGMDASGQSRYDRINANSKLYEQYYETPRNSDAHQYYAGMFGFRPDKSRKGYYGVTDIYTHVSAYYQNKVVTGRRGTPSAYLNKVDQLIRNKQFTLSQSQYNTMGFGGGPGRHMYNVYARFGATYKVSSNDPLYKYVKAHQNILRSYGIVLNESQAADKGHTITIPMMQERDRNTSMIYTALNADKQFGGASNAAALFPTRDAQFITNEQ